MPVQMNVIAHQIVGAYLSRLALSPAGRPATVAAFMEGLASFANDLLGVEAMEARYASRRAAGASPAFWRCSTSTATRPPPTLPTPRSR